MFIPNVAVGAPEAHRHAVGLGAAHRCRPAGRPAGRRTRRPRRPDCCIPAAMPVSSCSVSLVVVLAATRNAGDWSGVAVEADHGVRGRGRRQLLAHRVDERLRDGAVQPLTPVDGRLAGSMVTFERPGSRPRRRGPGPWPPGSGPRREPTRDHRSGLIAAADGAAHQRGRRPRESASDHQPASTSTSARCPVPDRRGVAGGGAKCSACARPRGRRRRVGRPRRARPGGTGRGAAGPGGARLGPHGWSAGEGRSTEDVVRLLRPRRRANDARWDAASVCGPRLRTWPGSGSDVPRGRPFTRRGTT